MIFPQNDSCPENARECIPAQYQDQDPRFAQKSCGKSWKYQDPRSKIPTRLVAKILEIPRSKILARSLVGILDLGSWYFQDFPQDFCANLGSWSWYWAGMHSECIERILTAFLPKWTNKSCNLRAQIYIYIYMVPPKKRQGSKGNPK